MTNKELADRLCDATGTISVTMSKHGISLAIGQVQYPITEEQAVIVWDVMPQLMKARRAARRD